jgi:hypothetical protein
MTDSESLFARLELDKARKRPPVSKWHPEQTGDSGIRIASDGRWYYHNSEIRRPEMVQLFSTILRRDGDRHFLVTPVERLSIVVDDAPFVAVDLEARGAAEAQCLVFLTNVGDVVAADTDHTIALRGNGARARPYVLVRDGLEALIARSVYYRLADLATTGPGGSLGVWSNSAFFVLETP